MWWVISSVIVVLLLGVGLVWHLSRPAYIVEGGYGKTPTEQMKCRLLYPNGEPVIEYDGNDPKHFPKWRPFVPATR